MFRRIIGSVVITLVAFSISGCGGGSGGGSGVGGSGLSVSKDNVSFTARQDDNTPAAAQVKITLGSGTVYLRDPTVTGSAVSTASVSINNDGTATLVIIPDNPGSFDKPGGYSSTVTVEGCTDQVCSGGSNAGSVSVYVSYDISAGLSLALSNGNLTFAGYENTLPDAQSVSLTWSNGSPPDWTVSELKSSYLTLTQDKTNNTLTVQPTAPLAVGDYFISVQIQYFLKNGTLRLVPLNVEYTVDHALTVSTGNPLYGSPTFILDQNSTVSDLTQMLTVQSQNGDTISWTATVAGSWINVTPLSGDTASTSQITLALNQADLDKFPAGEDHTATLTLTPSNAVYSPVIVNIRVRVDLPRVDYSGPSVIYSGSGDSVIVRGSGFNTFPSNIKVGSTPADSVTVDNDTQLTVSLPALNAGTYPVTLDTNTGIFNRYDAQLKVVDTRTHTYAALPNSGTFSKLIYDPARDDLYALDLTTNANQLDRYHYNGTKWVMDSLSLAQVQDMAITPDGDFLVFTEPSSLTSIDLSTFTANKVLNIDPASYNSYDLQWIAFTNSGLGIVSYLNPSFTSVGTLYKYDLRDDSFSLLQGNDAITGIAASRNGSRVIFATSGALQFYDSSNNTLSAQTTGYVDNPQVDRTGNHLLLAQGEVYDASFTFLGDLGSVVARTISDDGNYAYVLRADNSIYTYDLNSPNSTGGFTQVGTAISLADSPGTTGVQMAVSTDNKTLYIVGDSNFIVQPVP